MTILGLVSNELVLRPCVRCGKEVLSRLTKYVRRFSIHSVDEATYYQAEPHGCAGAKP